MSASWFCVRTRPDAEERVYLGILGSGVEAFMPIGLMRATYRTTRRRNLLERARHRCPKASGGKDALAGEPSPASRSRLPCHPATNAQVVESPGAGGCYGAELERIARSPPFMRGAGGGGKAE
jgi:hypothetical protein